MANGDITEAGVINIRDLVMTERGNILDLNGLDRIFHAATPICRATHGNKLYFCYPPTFFMGPCTLYMLCISFD